MSAIDNGGPAYPTVQQFDGNGNVVMYACPGASLRDVFAMHAMNGHVIALANMTVSADTKEEAKQKWANVIAELSYRTADAMLAARKASP